MHQSRPGVDPFERQLRKESGFSAGNTSLGRLWLCVIPYCCKCRGFTSGPIDPESPLTLDDRSVPDYAASTGIYGYWLCLVSCCVRGIRARYRAADGNVYDCAVICLTRVLSSKRPPGKISKLATTQSARFYHRRRTEGLNLWNVA